MRMHETNVYVILQKRSREASVVYKNEDTHSTPTNHLRVSWMMMNDDDNDDDNDDVNDDDVYDYDDNNNNGGGGGGGWEGRGGVQCASTGCI